MRLEIRYVNRFVYPTPARESHNLLRACPLDDAGQRLLDFRVTVDPPARIITYTDYWGTRVDAFGVRAPHTELLVTARSIVETSARTVPAKGTVALDAYADPAIRFDLRQYLRPSHHTMWNDAITAAARSAVGDRSDAVEAIAAVDSAVHAALEYRAGVTDVGVDIRAVFEAGAGVCQDYAHLAIAMYRSLGVPARYVSGFIYASDLSGGTVPDEAEVEIQTHAWVEAFVPGFGWWGLDPTNPQDVGERHVKIGHGRDYDDVMPLRGVYHGPAEHALGVSVRISREGLSRLQEQQVQQ